MTTILRFGLSERAFAVIVVFVLIFSTPASAISKERQKQFGYNQILFYDPEWTPAGSIDVCDYGTLSGSTLSEKVLSYLLSIGLTDYAAAGIYGNMMAEGLGRGSLLEHEDGVDDVGDIGSFYNGSIVTENDVRNLDSAGVMHGLGFIQWSFERRVNLLNALKAAGDLDTYARAWNGTRYTYDGLSYEELGAQIGEGVADAILITELEFFNSEAKGYSVTQDDINAQGISGAGVTAGMQLFDALNLLNSPEAAANLFFTTSEMPGYTNMFNHSSGSARANHAKEGYALISSKGIVGEGVTKCSGGVGGTIAEVAVQLSWPNADGTCKTDAGKVDWSSNKTACYDFVKDEYHSALIADLGSEPGGNYCSEYGHVSSGSLDYYQDCGHFVATVVHASGADPNFPGTGTKYMESYFDAHSDIWKEIENLENTSNLEPGDILIINNAEHNEGHIMIYTGSLSEYGDLASASLCTRTANMGNVYFTGSSGIKYRIFRYTGEESSTGEKE